MLKFNSPTALAMALKTALVDPAVTEHGYTVGPTIGHNGVVTVSVAGGMFSALPLYFKIGRNGAVLGMDPEACDEYLPVLSLVGFLSGNEEIY